MGPHHIKKVQQLLQTVGAKRVNKNVFMFWKQHRVGWGRSCVWEERNCVDPRVGGEDRGT